MEDWNLPEDWRRFMEANNYWHRRIPIDDVPLPEIDSSTIETILLRGDWHSTQSLRRKIGDRAIADWILSNNGGELTAMDLSFWRLILKLPKRAVNRMMKQPGRIARLFEAYPLRARNYFEGKQK
jgi:hypothetical protein